MNEQDEITSGRAFEYVSGTLAGAERSAYEALLDGNDAEAEQERALVKFWQEQLLALDKRAGDLPPDPATWQRIANTIGIADSSPPAKSKNSFITMWVGWGLAAVATLLLAVVLLQPLVTPPNLQPNTDYIAVLTDAEGKAVLTALTTAKDSHMWLQWETELFDGDAVASESTLQLWAISKRDGQIRSLAIFDDNSTDKLLLDEATFRLVTDAAFLLLTREEAGGSAIDEPSEVLVARGVCVRFGKDQPS